MKIDINKKYRYRSGKPARILCVDAPSQFPVIAIDDSGDPTTHTDEGRLLLGGESVHDLIEIREPREWTVAVRPGTCKVCEIYEDEGPLDLAGWERVRVREIID